MNKRLALVGPVFLAIIVGLAYYLSRTETTKPNEVQWDAVDTKPIKVPRDGVDVERPDRQSA